MKKLFTAILIALVSMGVSPTLADNVKTCKVSGTDGSVEAAAYIEDAENGIVSVTLSNDTERNVNVRYTVYAIAKNGGRLPAKNGAKLVYKNSEAAGTLKFGVAIKAVHIQTVSGQKCN